MNTVFMVYDPDTHFNVLALAEVSLVNDFEDSAAPIKLKINVIKHMPKTPENIAQAQQTFEIFKQYQLVVVN